MNKVNTNFIIILSFLLGLTACQEDEPNAPINVNFTNTSTNINEENQEAQISLVLSRASSEAGAISITIENSNLIYGKDNDFYTEPGSENKQLILNYESGQSEINFAIKAGSGLNTETDEIVTFRINSAEGIAIGQNSTLEVAFSENFIAESGRIQMNAGGPEFTQQAFVDLSKAHTLSIDKNTWDLGFYSGEGHYVALNSSAEVMARPLDKTDLNAVTAADTVGFGGEMQIGFSATPAAAAWVDEPTGDLSSTAIAAISAINTENKVYIIKRQGESRTWKKVKITQGDNGYKLSYANIASNDFQTVEIPKSETHNFTHFDLDKGIADFEPKQDSWDLMYGTYTEKFPLGPNKIPYSFKDYIVINRHNTSTAMVTIDENTTYEDFTIEQAESLTFNSEINSIGSSWRQGGSQNSAPALFEDRFFILKDAQQNFYKIRFISMYDANNERGITTFEFQILN